MAKVKITGHASGTGILTVTAPNTSTDRTITLPDSTATLFTDAGGTMTDTLSLQNNVSNSTSATLKLTGSSNVTQDNFILFGDNATSVPIAMGFDNSENTFKIARNSNDNLDSNIYFKMDSSGAVTMPAQPSFRATPTSEQTNISVDAWNTILFGTEEVDTNADFASSTFTAPVAGTYALNVNLYLQSLDSAAISYQASILTSNDEYTFFVILPPRIFDADSGFHAISGSAIADMDAGDTAIVRIYQEGGTAQTDINVSSVFTGHLLG